MNSIVDSADAEAPVRIIAGPTGAGKSALAIALAERHGALIISADSRQVYRGFDIGTAKPTAAERGRIPHEGIDVADAHERWSAVRWAEQATAAISEAKARRQPVLVVGGTGLWLRALLHPLAAVPPMDPGRRLALQSALADFDTPTLRRWIETLDPPRATLGRAQLTRAAEVALLTGTRLSDHHAAGAMRPGRAARWVIVDPGDELPTRLAMRLDLMIATGWADEVRALVATVPADAPAWNSCGYREIRDWVDGRVSEEAARQAIRISTRQYAKRQRTWFRSQLANESNVLRLDPRPADAVERADRWLFDGGSS